jgi:lysozyme
MYKSIDIYSETDVTDWNKVKADGVVIAYIKATDGVTYTNPSLQAQYNGAKSVGILVGLYHFAEQNSPLAEYNHFMSVASKYKQDIKPSLDYEVASPNMAFVKSFMAQDGNLILYASHNVANASGLPLDKIWIAEPNTNPTTTEGYAGIQDSWVGQVNGIANSQVDIDVFDTDILMSGAVAPSNIAVSNVAKAIQTELNMLLKSNLVTDGELGTLSFKVINQFKGAMGFVDDSKWDTNCVNAVAQIFSRPLDWVNAVHMEYATRYIQYRVGCAKDELGVFGVGTALALGQWQKVHGLIIDDKCEATSWAKMLDENC